MARQLSGEPTILAVEPASFQGPEQPHFEQRLLFCQVDAVGIIVGGLAAAVLTEATAQCDACLAVKPANLSMLRFQIGGGEPALDGGFEVYKVATEGEASKKRLGEKPLNAPSGQPSG